MKTGVGKLERFVPASSSLGLNHKQVYSLDHVARLPDTVGSSEFSDTPNGGYRWESTPKKLDLPEGFF